MGKNICKTFLYVANAYSDDGVLCDMVTFKQFEDGENHVTKKIFNFKFYFNHDVEFDTVNSSTLITYNSKIVYLIQRLKCSASDFKNDSYSWYVIKDSIVEYVKKVFDGDPVFDASDIILIDTVFDEMSFKYDRITVVCPEELTDADTPHVLIKFKSSADNYDDNAFIESIYINDSYFQVKYTDENCRKLDGNTMNTFVLPVLDILSRGDNYILDEVINYLTPYLILNAADFEFELS